MGTELKLGIADIVISLAAAGNNCELLLHPSEKSFVSSLAPEAAFEIHHGGLPKFSQSEMVFDSGGNWALYRERQRWIVCLRTPATGPVPYVVAVLERDFESGHVYVRAEESPPEPGLPRIHPLQYPLDEVLMVNLLSMGRGMMIHSCGVRDGNGGFVFAGTSGAGKSTIANLWKASGSTLILSDDRVIIRNTGGSFYAYGTPWPGDARGCSPEKALLKAVFFLKHAAENRLDRLSVSDAVSRLLVRSFPTFWNSEGMKFTLDFCAQLAEQIPCFELGFVPDERVLDIVRKAVPGDLTQPDTI